MEGRQDELHISLAAVIAGSERQRVIGASVDIRRRPTSRRDVGVEGDADFKVGE
jgi:hypothetical protein